MSDATRRQFLAFLGGSAATAAAAPAWAADTAKGSLGRLGRLTPVRLPHPLPIYSEKKSFLATGIDQGTILNPAANPNLLDYTVIDDVVVPPQYERYVIVAWGDRVFPRPDDYVGTLCERFMEIFVSLANVRPSSAIVNSQLCLSHAHPCCAGEYCNGLNLRTSGFAEEFGETLIILTGGLQLLALLDSRVGIDHGVPI